MCTWHACLFPASGIRPSYTRHLISGSRHCFFMIFIRSWCHMGLFLYSSHSSPHGHIRTLYNTKYFQSFYHLLFAIYHLRLSAAYFYPAARDRIFFTRRLTSGSRRVAFIKLFLFFNDMPSFCILFPFAYYLTMPAARNRIFFTRRLTSGSRRDLFLYFFYVYHSWLMFSHSLSFLCAFTCFLYISSAIDIFGYFPCLLRHTVFCYVLAAAGSRSSFGYYHLSRQQLLLCFICMHCFSITYVWCAY